MSAAMAVAVALLMVVSSFITSSVLAAAGARRSRIGRVVLDDKWVIQFCAPTRLNNARIHTRRASHILQVLDLLPGHQRRPSIQPVTAEAATNCQGLWRTLRDRHVLPDGPGSCVAGRPNARILVLWNRTEKDSAKVGRSRSQCQVTQRTSWTASAGGMIHT